MEDTAVGTTVLEMQEPAAAVWAVDPRALMWAVDIGGTLRHHNPRLVGAVDVARAHGELPAVDHSSCGSENPVPTVALIEFRAFDGMVHAVVAVEHYNRVGDGARTVGRKLSHGNQAVETASRGSPAVDHIEAPVVVPERRRVYDALSRHHKHRL